MPKTKLPESRTPRVLDRERQALPLFLVSASPHVALGRDRKGKSGGRRKRAGRRICSRRPSIARPDRQTGLSSSFFSVISCRPAFFFLSRVLPSFAFFMPLALLISLARTLLLKGSSIRVAVLTSAGDQQQVLLVSKGDEEGERSSKTVVNCVRDPHRWYLKQEYLVP